MNKLTDAELDNLTVLLEQAAPGEWVFAFNTNTWHYWDEIEKCKEEYEFMVENDAGYVCETYSKENGELIAVMHNYAPALLAEIRENREIIETLNNEIATQDAVKTIESETFIVSSHSDTP